MRSLLMMLVALSMLGAPATGRSGVDTAGATVSVAMEIGGCAIPGSAEPNVSFRLRHENAHGQLKASHLVTSNGSGDWDVPCPGPPVRGGDRLEFREVGQSTPFRVFIVPGLELATDRVRDRATGMAPRVDSVSLRLLVCDALAFGCTAFPEDLVAVDPGTRRFAWQSDQNMVGTSRVELRWSKGDDTVTLTQHAAVMVVRLGSSQVTGFGRRPDQSVTVSLRRGQAIGTTTRTTRADAGFAGAFKRGRSAMKARVGDSVSSSIASDATMVIPDVSLEVTAAGASGMCIRNRQVTVRIRDETGAVQRTSTLIADGAGAWNVDEPISAGWTVDVWCVNAKGDQVRLHALAD
jgi:hypothetical protein